jgi:hypothetical protein
MNTKKDFERAAAVVADFRKLGIPESRCALVEAAFVDFFTGENPRFDGARFRKACKPTKVEPARLDADRKAKPRTRIIGHGRAGDCQGPGITRPDAIEDTETGERTPLA